MQKNILLFILAATLIFLVGCTSSDTQVVLSEVEALEDTVSGAESSFDVKSEPKEEAEGAEEVQVKVFVYVCGAVRTPGVYELSEGSRCVDAVEAAGGFSEEADKTYVNLAALLTDGARLLIPTTEETKEAEGAGEIDSFDGEGKGAGSGLSEGGGAGGLININRASKEELTAIPGIGNATAEKIVKYREEHGSFKQLEDIMKVSGIKDKLFSRIRDYITV